jgi:hypothetical protein
MPEEPGSKRDSNAIRKPESGVRGCRVHFRIAPAQDDAVRICRSDVLSPRTVLPALDHSSDRGVGQEIKIHPHDIYSIITEGNESIITPCWDCRRFIAYWALKLIRLHVVSFNRSKSSNAQQYDFFA